MLEWQKVWKAFAKDSQRVKSILVLFAITLPETNIAPETQGFENEWSFLEGLIVGAIFLGSVRNFFDIEGTLYHFHLCSLFSFSKFWLVPICLMFHRDTWFSAFSSTSVGYKIELWGSGWSLQVMFAGGMSQSTAKHCTFIQKHVVSWPSNGHTKQDTLGPNE